MRSAVKSLLDKIPVPLAIWIESAKRRVAPAAGYRRICSIMSHLGNPEQVLAGPFKGMKYVGQAIGSAYLPKVLGSYEHELHAIVERTLSAGHDRMIDFGAAEGYYAVGYAWRQRSLKVITFDIDRRGRYLQAQMAHRNGVADRVEIRGAGDAASLNAAIEGASNPLLICDCEGYEDALLRPDLAPHLARTTVLVEMHDHLVPGVSQRVTQRFSATHDVTSVNTAARAPASFFEKLTPEDAAVISEGRPADQQWLYLTPRR